MSQLMITVIVVGMMVPTDGSQHAECIDCPDGSIPLSPLSYNTMRSNVFNGTQPSNEGCTNGVSIDGQVTIDCGQGTTLIDCDRGHNYTINYSSLSSYFIWNRTTLVAQQVSIVFRFEQQINISRITMFFWNSSNTNIVVPNVKLAWADRNLQFVVTKTIITTNSPNSPKDGRSILNIYIENDRLKFLYLRITMTFHSNNEWIFLSEVQFCGNTAPYHITQPSTDNDVQIVSPTATMTNITCSLNITIPENMTIVWYHNISNAVSGKEVSNTTTTLPIRNFQTSSIGVYQCVFIYGWTLRRNILVKVPQIIRPSADNHRVTAYMSNSISLTCSLNIKIPSSVTVTWIRNSTVITIPTNKIIKVENTTTSTLQIENLQLSDTGVYQCVFNDTANGWTLSKSITLLITAATTTSTAAATTTTTVSLPTSTTETTITEISSVISATIIPSSTASTASSIPSSEAGISGTVTPFSTTTDVTPFITVSSSSSATTDDASLPTTIKSYSTSTIIPSFITVISSSSTSTNTSTFGIMTSTFTVTLSTDISTTNTSLTSTSASTNANTTVRSPTTSISAKSSTTVTIFSTTISTTTPTAASNADADEDTSSLDDINIGILAIPVIVIMVVTLVIIVVIITFFCRRKRRYTHKPTSSTEEWEPTYNTIADPPPVTRNSNLYETLDQWKRMSLEQPRRRSLSSSSSSEASLESPQVSPEESIRYLEFNIYADPDDVKSNIPSTVFDFETQAENPTYDVLHNSMHNEGIGPGDIDSSAHACTSEHDGAYPYSSIYADARPLFRSQGPPVVTVENIKEVEQLGTGHFGKVILADTVGLSKKHLGIGNSNDTTITMQVAVKMLKANRSEEVQKSFEKEIKFMSRLKDDNVIGLLGICTTGMPFIMMEYMENGDLNKYLKEQELTLATETEKAEKEITLHTLIYMSFQIASGMKYLSTCKFIHRDLAARNILVGTDYVVKIADFGMSRNLYSADYCRVKQNVLPVRWMACECFYGKFSIQTDVWAFGITLWEIFTLCKYQPYSEFSDQEMIDDAVLGSNRKIPEQPENCPSDVYDIITNCLRHEPSERPAFSVLHDQLKECDSYVL